MTGDDVKALRMSLNLPVSIFADIVGADVSSVHRWEAEKDEDLELHTAHRRLLVVMAARLPASHAFGAKLEVWYHARGALYALYRMLDVVYGDCDAPG